MDSKRRSAATENCDSDYLVCVAIDIGTAYSGYAFQLFKDHKQDPLNKIYGPMWYHGDIGGLSMKTNTALLLNPDKSFCEIGYVTPVFLDKDSQLKG